MRTPKLRELGEAVRSLVGRPYTSRFPKEPSVPFPAFRGKPEFVRDECVGCSACAEVCPAGCIHIEDKVDGSQGGTRTLTLHYDHCIFCGQCQRNCLTEKGIHLTNKYDLATYDRTQAVERIEKELALCEHCGAVISTVEHLRWVARNMGAKAYASPGLLLVLSSEIGAVGETAPRPDGRPIGRADHLRVLCPQCRREVVLTEEWG
jgi:hydrogenase-4 component H